MNHVLTGLTLSLLLLASSETEARKIGYELRLLPGDPPRVQVTLETRGDPGGASRFAVSESWGGEERLAEEIHDLTLHAGDRELALEVTDDHTWSVRHDPGEPLRATYFLETDPDHFPVDFERHYRPIVSEGLFHLIGNTGLIYPEHLDGEERCAITLTWRGFAEEGWKTVSSVGADPEGGTAMMTLSAFRHSLFLAGDLDVTSIEIRGGVLQTALHGKDWGFTVEQFNDLARRVVLAEREFFSDFTDLYFLVSAIPVGRKNRESLSLGGTGLENCFALFMAPGMDLDAGSRDETAIKRLLAHEYFHTWNGRKIRRVDPEELVYWFSEGFTDFYARRLLLRAGLYSREEFLTDLNDSIRTYHTGSVRNAPNERILADFWTDRNVRDLPYRRGDLVAVAIDEAIRARSEGKRSLDDLMHELLRRAREHDEKVSTDGLLALVGRYTSPEFAKTIREVVVDGKTVELPERLSEPEATRKIEPVHAFSLGFDHAASEAARVVKGVDPDSAAFEAGLRDGHKIKGWSIHWGDVSRPVILTVQIGRQERRIRYLPRGEEIEVPRYH